MQFEIFSVMSDYLIVGFLCHRSQRHSRRSDKWQAIIPSADVPRHHCMAIQEKQTLQQVAQLARVVKRLTSIKRTSEVVQGLPIRVKRLFFKLKWFIAHDISNRNTSRSWGIRARSKRLQYGSLQLSCVTKYTLKKYK